MQSNDNSVDGGGADFVSRTVSELIRRGSDCPDGECTTPMSTLRWFDYFAEFFLRDQGHGHPCPHNNSSQGEDGWDDGDEDDDDILYFIPTNQTDDPELSSSPSHRLLVKRRPVNGALPPLEAVIQWEETFAINLLARLCCHLRLTVLEAGGRIISEVVHRVYADPVRGQEQHYQSLLNPSRQEAARAGVDGGVSVSTTSSSFPFHPAYPMIYFHCHGSDETNGVLVSSGQTLCVELRALFRSNTTEEQKRAVHVRPVKAKEQQKLSSPLPQQKQPPSSLNHTPSYVAWRTGSDSFPLFQGAVSHEALRKVHRRKVGLNLSALSGILMRGPTLGTDDGLSAGRGKSFAQLVVRSIDAPSLPVHLWRKFLRRGGDTGGTTGTATTNATLSDASDSQRQLQCQLRFIYMNWRPLVQAIFHHHRNYSQHNRHNQPQHQHHQGHHLNHDDRQRKV